MARELLAAGYDLICPVRPGTAGGPDSADPAGGSAADRAAGATGGRRVVIPTELTDAEGLNRDLADFRADAVVSCIASRGGGIRDSHLVDYVANHNLLAWAEQTGVAHFTLLSAICVQKPRLAFQFEKLRFEQALAGSTLSHSIVRPTAFFKSLSGQVQRVRDGRPFLLFGDGTLTRCKPIAEADLARYLRRTLEDPALRGVLPIGGPGPAITPRDQALLLADLADQPLRTRSVSPGLLSGVGALLALPGRLVPALADKAEFARIGHYYATESMLLWDADKQRYDADATPEYGEITLADSYRRQLAGESVQNLGEHKLFS